jgi:hypothetical protein
VAVITGTPLHVITGPFCNEITPLQWVITRNYSLQRLQKRLVISCNRGLVIAAISGQVTPGGVPW